MRTFDARCRDTQSASDQLQLCELSGLTSRFTMQEFSMVGNYIEDLEKPQNCQNWGVGARLAIPATMASCALQPIIEVGGASYGLAKLCGTLMML